ncbi:hypothetical protein OPT61_g5725 [Boeremia exigua]|uniref:Uncharacterized protein n=1 Tax=Boeremia exigua TaxID=749465 RepID=A0ACC2I9F9_9PLEO|nr:hypothetical protein OPT61_g5725 [Boeremia exigua]
MVQSPTRRPQRHHTPPNMADIHMHSSSSAYTILEQARQEFWNSTGHLSEEQRQEAWAASLYPSNAFDIPAQPSRAQHIPRTMPNSMPNLTQYPMDRTQSAPVSRPSSNAESIDLRRSTSDFGAWPVTASERASYALYSEPLRTPASLQAIPKTTVEYTPGDYIHNCIEASSPSAPLHNLHVQLTPQWGQSSDCSTSPSTPQTALMTPVTQSSNAMSRQSSLNPFLDESLRVPSDLFSMPILPEDSALSFSSSCFDGSKFDSSFLSFTGPAASETLVFPAFSSVSAAPASALALGAGQNASRRARASPAASAKSTPQPPHARSPPSTPRPPLPKSPSSSRQTARPNPSPSSPKPPTCAPRTRR